MGLWCYRGGGGGGRPPFGKMPFLDPVGCSDLLRVQVPDPCEHYLATPPFRNGGKMPSQALFLRLLSRTPPPLRAPFSVALSITTTRTTGSIGSTCPPLSRVWQSKATNQPTSQPVTTEQEKYKPTRTALRLSISDIETLQHSRRGRESETPSAPPPNPSSPAQTPPHKLNPTPAPPQPHPKPPKPQTQLPIVPDSPPPQTPNPPTMPKPTSIPQPLPSLPTQPPLHTPPRTPKNLDPSTCQTSGTQKKKKVPKNPQNSPKIPKNPQKNAPPKISKRETGSRRNFLGICYGCLVGRLFGAFFWGFWGNFGFLGIYGDFWGFLAYCWSRGSRASRQGRRVRPSVAWGETRLSAQCASQSWEGKQRVIGLDLPWPRSAASGEKANAGSCLELLLPTRAGRQ